MSTKDAANNSLTVIMPALNEVRDVAASVETTLRAFEEFSVVGEIIVVNDGSTDGTDAVVEKLMEGEPRIKLINHETPLGIGRSYWDGVSASACDLVILVPGDNEMDPRHVLRYINLMDHVDILVPFFINKEVRDRGRRVLSSSYRFIVNVSFGVGLNYTNGSVIYRRSILEEGLLRSMGFFYQTELLVKLIRKGYLYAEVPNFILKRVGGESKAISLRSLINVVSSYLSLFYDIHVRRIDTYSNNYRVLDKQSISYKERQRQKALIDTSYYSD